MQSGTKYQILHGKLQKRLEAMVDGERLPSVRALQDEYGVSLATLTAALKMLEDEGMVHSIPYRGVYKCTAQTIVAPQRTVTLLLPGRGECLFSKIISSCHAALYRRDCKLNLAVYQLCAESENEQLHEQLRDNADGVLYMPTFETPETVAAMTGLAAVKPLVQIDREIGDGAASAIGYRLFESSYRATELLIRHGRTRIGMIAPLEKLPGQAERAAGFRAALRDYELTENASWHISFNSQDLNISTDLGELLSGANRPDAFFATNSVFSARLFQKLAQYGIRMPDDICVTAFDLPETFANLPQRITYISEPTGEVCVRAVDLLFQMLATGSREVVREMLPGRLVPGATCPVDTADCAEKENKIARLA